MESIAAPLRALEEEARWFARDGAIRMLHVVTSVDLRDAVMKIVMGQEFHADNRAPFVRLDDSFSRADGGWAVRSTRLLAQHVERLEALGVVGTPLAGAPGRDALAAFASNVRWVADQVPPPMTGLVVVLAPTRVADANDWEIAVRALVTSPGLAGVRWVVVEPEASTLDATVRELGAAALHVTAAVDEAALDQDISAALGRVAAAPTGATAHAAMGAAWPRGVAPPPRRNAPTLPPAELKAAMVAAGISPAITPDEGRALRLLLLKGADALKTNRGPEAVRLQCEARDLCSSLGMAAESVLMELILGTYLVQLHQHKLAIDTFRTAVGRAEAAGLKKEAAQGQLALGALAAVDGRANDAATAYTRAGTLARGAGIALLAIEAYRLAGVYCADVELKVQTWKQALDIADELDHSTIKASSAAEVARALAAVLRKHGLTAQAVDMENQSVALEGGEAPAAAQNRSSA